MKKWLLICAALVISGCSSEQVTQYYQLPAQPVAGGSYSQAADSRHQLWIEQVSVPDYLASNGVVYQTSAVEYTIATQNLWATPLDQQLKTSLISGLSNNLPGWIVSSQPLGNEQASLSVAITDFQGRYDGHVVVSGEWLFNRQGALTKKSFRVELAQVGDGYPAMIQALGKAWNQEVKQMASQITNL